MALSFLYRLITTTTDPSQAPAAELAGLHPERWEFETALAETKTHQRGSRVVLRSKAPEGVTQELYGHFCVRYAARWLMHTVALVAGGDPDRVLPPQVLDEAHDKAAGEILFELLGPRRLRSNPRVVKRKTFNFGVKRRKHRNWPKPTRTPEQAVAILGS